MLGCCSVVVTPLLLVESVDEFGFIQCLFDVVVNGMESMLACRVFVVMYVVLCVVLAVVDGIVDVCFMMCL